MRLHQLLSVPVAAATLLCLLPSRASANTYLFSWSLANFSNALRSADFGGNCASDALTNCAVYDITITPADGSPATVTGVVSPASTWIASTDATPTANAYLDADDVNPASTPNFISDSSNGWVSGKTFSYTSFLQGTPPAYLTVTRTLGSLLGTSGTLGVILSLAGPSMPTQWNVTLTAVGLDLANFKQRPIGVKNETQGTLLLNTASVTAVPEPGSLALIGLGLLAVGIRVRGRR